MKNESIVRSLIDSLKAEATTPLEKSMIARFEKDFFQGINIEIIDDGTQRFNGVIFRKTKSKLYQCTFGLHQAIWSYYNGEIPPGYEIHHIDVNPSNNDPSNLRCVSRSEHMKIHQELRRQKFTCDNCGNEILKTPSRHTAHHFCDSVCMQAFWRKQGGYPRTRVTRQCVIGGQDFQCRNSAATQTCSASCAGKLRFANSIKRGKR